MTELNHPIKIITVLLIAIGHGYAWTEYGIQAPIGELFAIILVTGYHTRLAKSDSNPHTRGSDFEIEVARYFQSCGYRVAITGKSGDQGVDVIAERNGNRVAIQVKHHARPVGNTAIQEVHAGMTHYGCNEAVVVTTSTFTKSAVDLARSCQVTLVDGETYREARRRVAG